jgi:hypothetical protein
MISCALAGDQQLEKAPHIAAVVFSGVVDGRHLCKPDEVTQPADVGSSQETIKLRDTLPEPAPIGDHEQERGR